MSLTYIHLKPNCALPELKRSACRVLLVAECAVSAAWREYVAHWLVDAGCLYFVAWGSDSESWHDSVDEANLKAFDYGNIPDTGLVLTTWHHEEPLSEAMTFAEHIARHPVADLDARIIIHVARVAREAELKETYRAVERMSSSD